MSRSNTQKYISYLALVVVLGGLFALGVRPSDLVQAIGPATSTPAPTTTPVTTYTVTNTNDSGAGSLREGLSVISAGGTIDFALTYPATITLTDELGITQDVTIDGPGADKLALSGGNAGRVLNIDGNCDLITVAIDGLTIQDGATSGYDTGAGIRAACANLALEGMDIINNTGKDAGGGIHISSSGYATGTITISNTRILSNTAAWGGGLYIEDIGSLQIDNSIISYNRADDDEGTGGGGGVYTDYVLDSDVIRNTQIVSNTADFGGGLYAYGSQDLEISGGLFDKNTALVEGGAVYVTSDCSSVTMNSNLFTNNHAAKGGAIYGRSTLHLLNSTLYHNSSTALDDGGSALNIAGTAYVTHTTIYSNTTAANGGAVRIADGAGTYSFVSTIIGANTGDNCSFENGTFVGGGYTIVDDGTCTNSLTRLARLPAIMQIPFLRMGALGDYGGRLATVPTLPGSPAIDFAPADTCPTTDQRGVVRPQADGCDIGAFESRGFTLAIAGGNNQSALWDADFSTPLIVTVSSSHGEPVDGGAIRFIPPTSGPSAYAKASRYGLAEIISGAGSITGTANSLAGNYSVTTTTSGALISPLFSMTNLKHATEISATVAPTTTLYAEFVSFTATVTDTDGGSAVPTGWVTFTLTGADGPTSLDAVQLDNDGTATAYAQLLPVDQYTAVATYGGDDNYNKSTSSTVNFTVNPRPTTVSVSNSETSSTYGNVTSFMATVAVQQMSPDSFELSEFVATGVVTFTEGATVLGTATLDEYGRATFSTNNLLGGSHSISATYGGDTICAISTTTEGLVYTVTRSSTKTSVYAAPATTPYGDPVTLIASPHGVATPSPLAATTMPVQPTGSVVFKEGETVLGSVALDANGVAKLDLNTLTAGAHEIRAHYQGDTNYLTSVSDAHTQTVNVTLPAITISPPDPAGKSFFGQTTTFTVTMQGGLSPAALARHAAGAEIQPPTGKVTLQDGEIKIGSEELVNGTATFSVGDLSIGKHSLTVAYAGDSNYEARVSEPLLHTVWMRLFLPSALNNVHP